MTENECSQPSVIWRWAQGYSLSSKSALDLYYLGIWTPSLSMSPGCCLLWKDWCWSWNFNTLATWCEGLTHLKRPWCWERLRAVGEGAKRGWDAWMASLTQWTWVWVNAGSWRWTGKPGLLQSMGSQRVGYDWATELNWTGLHI